MTLAEFFENHHEIVELNEIPNSMSDVLFLENIGQSASAISLYKTSLRLLSDRGDNMRQNFVNNRASVQSTITLSGS